MLKDSLTIAQWSSLSCFFGVLLVIKLLFAYGIMSTFYAMLTYTRFIAQWFHNTRLLVPVQTHLLLQHPSIWHEMSFIATEIMQRQLCTSVVIVLSCLRSFYSVLSQEHLIRCHARTPFECQTSDRIERVRIFWIWL